MKLTDLQCLRLSLAAASLAVLAGCASVPPPTATPMEQQPAALATTELDAWWRLFDDPILDLFVDRALTASPDARLIAARLEAAEAARREALAINGLQGDLGSDISGRRTERLSGDGSRLPAGTAAGAQVTLPVSWEVDFWGRRAARSGIADADLAAARFSLEAGRALLAARTVEAIQAIRAADARLAEATAQVAIQEELARLARLRGERGLSPVADVAALEAALSSSEASIIALAAERDANRRALAGLIGDARGPDPDVGPLRSDVPSAPRLVDAALLARRPDVREAQARLASASGRERLAQLAMLPSVSWSPGIGVSSVFEPGSALGGFWSMGFTIAAPILDRPRLMAMLGGETARRAEAVADLEKSVQAAFVEADQGFLLLEAETRRADRLRDAADAAQRSFHTARRRYEVGLDSIDGVLITERALRESRSAELDARISRIDRTLQLFKALGGGWSPTASNTASQGETP